MGIMVTYGSYVPKSENLAKSAGWICALDTLVAVMAALAIVPVVMITQGEEGLGMGGGFAFISLPAMFAELPGGRFFGMAFFALLFLAALTSAISILESLVAFLTEEFHLSRARAAIGLSVPMALLSAGYSLSQSAGRGINLPWFDFKNGLQMLPMNAVMEKFTDNLMIPLGALCFCLFVGCGAPKPPGRKSPAGTASGGCRSPGPSRCAFSPLWSSWSSCTSPSAWARAPDKSADRCTVRAFLREY